MKNHSFALGCSGNMWLYFETDSTFVRQHEKSLKELGFDYAGDKYDVYGTNYIECVFNEYFEEDTLLEEDIESLTKDICSKIEEIIAL